MALTHCPPRFASFTGTWSANTSQWTIPANTSSERSDMKKETVDWLADNTANTTLKETVTDTKREDTKWDTRVNTMVDTKKATNMATKPTDTDISRF